ncbi:MAG: hypothetical protein WCQ50_13150, partial [Spirochaetota bacterium]
TNDSLGGMIADAVAGKPVYITRAHALFATLPEDGRDRLALVIELLDQDGRKAWDLWIPTLEGTTAEELAFVREYVQAEVYNILSSIGARSMTIFVDHGRHEALKLALGLDEAFCIGLSRSQRNGYGRSVNVLDRMIEAVRPGEAHFRFAVSELSQLPFIPPLPRPDGDSLAAFRACTLGLEGKAFCGIDVGGTDIKAVLVDDGRIIAYKEYDWFPASFLKSSQLVDPIVLVTRLLSGRLWLHHACLADGRSKVLLARMESAMDKDADDAGMADIMAALESEGFPGGSDSGSFFDGIGLCFPDVVVRNKIVGGEVYKTRGIRNNPAIDYESDFAHLTELDECLKAFVKTGGRVRIINDGPMASFTAAVEMAISPDAAKVAKGVFAHTLGTELGTGWVTEAGGIPDIPLEVYNFIIDLGSSHERAYGPDDLRSINNFNTGLPGTLQKYCSQSGVFRLAMKYFPEERPDLFRELGEKGFVETRQLGEITQLIVPTEPVDRRKPFLEHMMALIDREGDETNRRIWRELGESLAVTFLETTRILEPGPEERFLFGRLVKNRRCFDLMVEGAQGLKADIRLVVAGTGMANSSLMKQLDGHPQYSLAQFAQAIGAVYFANLGPKAPDFLAVASASTPPASRS